MKKLNYYSKLPIIWASGRLGIRRALTLSFSFCFLTVLLYSMGSSYEYDRSYVDDSFIVDKEVKSNSSVHNERTSDGMTLEMKGASGENALDGCDFIVTKAEILPNGDYYFCVVSLVPAQAEGWYALQGTDYAGAQTASGSEACFTFPGSGPNAFFIKHYTTTDSCFTTISLAENFTCPPDLIEIIREDTCGTDIIIVVDTSQINLSSRYVIDWGDGTYTQSLDDTLYHSYCEPGKYPVCITTSISPTEPHLYTCCYEADVENEDCICLPDLIANTGQICDTTCITVTYPDVLDGRPIRVTLPGGSPIQLTGDTTLKHIFPSPGDYQICFDYIWCEEVRQCCYIVPVENQCCTSADFYFALSLDQISCINPQYDVRPDCTTGGPNEHIWLFEDGFRFEGVFPPSPYMFTDFVNDDNEVCITHIIICCGDTVDVVTRCIPRDNGVWLGRPGETRRLTDEMLNQTWGTTVHDFLLNTYQGPAPYFPLIDGTLILDEPSDFEQGRFYMGSNAEIINEGQHFGLSSMRIQSAWRFPGRPYSCCFWLGVRSQGDTEMVWDRSEVSDAHFMLHYPSRSAAGLPIIDLDSNFFHTNMFGIKSVNQNILVRDFQRNQLIGEDPSLNNSNSCGCSAINAIDFRSINSAEQVHFPNTGGVNIIRDYEHGIHFENANLEARNFRIHSNREMTIPVPPSGIWANSIVFKRGMGIYFDWERMTNSSLNFDEFEIYNMDDGVYMEIYGGLHELTARASNRHTSIWMSDVLRGYDISVNRGNIDGLIQANYIRGLQSGIIGNFFGEPQERMHIVDNEIVVSNASGLGNGVLLNSSFNVAQQFLVRLNDITANGVSGGVGIGTNGARNSTIEHNYIGAAGDNMSGIRLFGGGESRVRCNTVDDVDEGVDINFSRENEIARNTLKFNRHDLTVAGDAMGNGGSFIRWNIFQQSNFESVNYDASAITGPQEHSFLNSWTGQFGVEARHGNQLNATMSRFLYPENDPLGSQYYPQHQPGVLFEDRPISYQGGGLEYCAISTEPDTPIISGPSFVGYPSDSVYNEILLDTTSFTGYTPAQLMDFDLGLYDLLGQNPGWKSAYTSLSDFYDLHENGYVGSSVALRDSVRLLLETFDNQRGQIIAWQLDLDSLSGELTTQYLALSNCSTTSCKDSVNLIIGSIANEADSLENLIGIERDSFEVYNLDKIDSLLAINNALTDTALYQWSERVILDVTLRLMKSDTLTAQDKQDLETIAMYCDEDAGQWVYEARMLCLILYQEYYDEDNCIQALMAGSNTQVAPRKLELQAYPNPSNGQFRVEWNESMLDAANLDLQILDLQILDLSGRVVKLFPKVVSGAYLDASDIPGGIYILKAQGSEIHAFGKLIIQ